MTRDCFRYALDAVAAVEKEEARHARRVTRFHARAGTRRSRDWKRERRLGLLEARVPDRRCPACGEVRLESRGWVLFDGHVRWLPSEANTAGAVCRSCWWRRGRKNGEK